MIECPYRVFVSDSGERATCQLVLDQIGQARGELARVDAGSCRYCLTLPEPTVRTPNALVASLLVSIAIPEPGSEPSLPDGDANKLAEFAIPFLEMRRTAPADSRIPKYDRACFYLGEERGLGEYKEQHRTVKRKVYACHHERHHETTIAGCRQCCDYDRLLGKGEVKTWAVGMTTAPRKRSTVADSLKSLVRAGWSTPVVFAEPGSDREALRGQRVVERESVLGAWPNWFLGLHELVLRAPHADAYLMCQDDLAFCSGVREYLESTLWPEPRTGIVSLHTPSHHRREDQGGFFAQNVGWGAWGAMAYVIPNPAARALLRDASLVNHRNRGPREGRANVDSVLGDWCRRSGLAYLMHAPSLCEHTGHTSTLWKNATLAGRRLSGDFPGEDHCPGKP